MISLSFLFGKILFEYSEERVRETKKEIACLLSRHVQTDLFPRSYSSLQLVDFKFANLWRRRAVPVVLYQLHHWLHWPHLPLLSALELCQDHFRSFRYWLDHGRLWNSKLKRLEEGENLQRVALSTLSLAGNCFCGKHLRKNLGQTYNPIDDNVILRVFLVPWNSYLISLGRLPLCSSSSCDGRCAGLSEWNLVVAFWFFLEVRTSSSNRLQQIWSWKQRGRGSHCKQPLSSWKRIRWRGTVIAEEKSYGKRVSLWWWWIAMTASAELQLLKLISLRQQD